MIWRTLTKWSCESDTFKAAAANKGLFKSWPVFASKSDARLATVPSEVSRSCKKDTGRTGTFEALSSTYTHLPLSTGAALCKPTNFLLAFQFGRRLPSAPPARR
eukprot:SRR837773.13814.p1 GENE.SRR837773.13814~~SRR837773.13814.p1  ORF type:complete len:104 (+),score=15.65 SRR837773.13814:93-404(+)